MVHIIFITFGWNNSLSVRGVLSSKTISACHFEPKAVNISKIDMTSLPFSVMVQRTIIGDFPFSTHSINPSFSSSFKRIDNTLGVSPGIESRSLLNLSTSRIPKSLNTSIDHFLPSIPRLLLIGHCANFTPGKSLLSWWDIASCLQEVRIIATLFFALLLLISILYSSDNGKTIGPHRKIETGNHMDISCSLAPKKNLEVLLYTGKQTCNGSRSRD